MIIGSPISQSTLRADPARDQSSDSDISCRTENVPKNMTSLSDIELSDASSKSKGRRRNLPLTPSDIEALSDEGVMIGDKMGKVFLRRGKCMPRRLTKDSGLGESLVGCSTSKRRPKTAYPWRQNGKKYKEYFYLLLIVLITVVHLSNL